VQNREKEGTPWSFALGYELISCARMALKRVMRVFDAVHGESRVSEGRVMSEFEVRVLERVARLLGHAFRTLPYWEYRGVCARMSEAVDARYGVDGLILLYAEIAGVR